MRIHITLDSQLVERLDSRVGSRRRSAFISETVKQALEDDQRWEDIETGLGALAGAGHEWDADPGAWVRTQRQGDPRRVG